MFSKNLVGITDIKTNNFNIIPIEKIQLFVAKGKISQNSYEELQKNGIVNIYEDENKSSGIKLELLNVEAVITKERGN